MKLKDFFRTLGKVGSGVATGMTIEGWIRGNNLETLERETREIYEKNSRKEAIIRDFLEEKIEDVQLKQRIFDESQSIKASLERVKNADESLTHLFGKFSESGLSAEDKAVLHERLITTKKSYSESIVESDKILDKIIALLNQKNGGGGNQSFISSNEILTSFQQFIDGLTQEQKFALIHIFSSIFILFCLFSLIGVFLGNEFIERIQLIKRFPRLEKYILLRQKFKWYYFVLNSLLIILMLLVIISLNVYAFTL
jgi:hypothetical protein